MDTAAVVIFIIPCTVSLQFSRGHTTQVLYKLFKESSFGVRSNFIRRKSRICMEQVA